MIANKSPYTFGITQNKEWIVIGTEDGKEKPYRVETLRNILANVSGYYSAPVVDMAREALQAFDLLPSPEEETLSSFTIATIEGIKIYMEWAPLRQFFARIRGSKIYGSLSDLEKKIKGES